MEIPILRLYWYIHDHHVSSQVWSKVIKTCPLEDNFYEKMTSEIGITRPLEEEFLSKKCPYVDMG